MKQSFTQFHPLLLRLAKMKGTTPEEILSWFEKEMNDGSNDKIVSSLAFRIEMEVLRKNCVHIFLPDRAFCDWIVSCVSKMDGEHAIILQDLFGPIPAVLHFPTQAHLPSVACLVVDNFACKRKSDSQITNKTCLIIAPSIESLKDGADCNLVILDGQDDDESLYGDGAFYISKLIVGLGMYCNCFPETLRDGPPEDLKHPSFHNYQMSRTVGISAKIVSTGTHDSPVAHFRRGHFRVLRSEKFINKRFQAVFVRETFVAGKSKTVLTPEEVSCHG